MISTFFSTSKPIHYLLVLIITSLFIASAIWMIPQTSWWYLLGILLIGASLAVFQFVIIKNELTATSTFALWSAMLFTLSFIAFKVPILVLVSLVFLILALRRLLSLKSGYASIQKIFDASFWICIATIFFHWSILFMIVVFIAIFLYVRNNYRNWVTPFIALACVWFLLFTYDYVWEDTMLKSIYDSFKFTYLWEMINFSFLEILLLILLGMAVIGLFIYLSKLIDIQQSVRPRFTILMFAGLMGIVIATIDFTAFSRGGFLLIIPSLSIFIARATHRVQRKLWKEILLFIPLLWLVAAYLA